ncbi:MAG: hypothetical protein U0929_07745 [Planctomycetaceae bacterium]
MFTAAIQRIVWKEFRAQRVIWFGIAFELVILQLVRAFSPDKFPINLVSLACVLTGIFAMTSSALLFAGESEAQTDGFLRQLPFRSRDLILGKLGFNIAAVASFLAFSLLAAKLISGIGTAGRTQVGDYEEAVAYANSVLGLWVWGIFYSLLTRKVMWTLLGAALTEIAINAALHGVLKGYWYAEPTIYAIYHGVALLAVLVDLWLLSRWYSGVRGMRANSRSMTASTAGESAVTPSRPLPWSTSWKITSRVGIAFGVIWYILLLASAAANRGRPDHYVPLLLLFGVIGAVIGSIVVMGIRTIGQISSGHSTGVNEHDAGSQSLTFSMVLKEASRLLGLFGFSILALALGIAVGFCGVVFLIVVFLEWRPGAEHALVVSGVAAVTFGGGFVLWAVGRLLDAPVKIQTNRLPLRTLQFAQSACQSINRSWGSLFWIEARRVLPFLITGLALAGLVVLLFSLSRSLTSGINFFGLSLLSYSCGLMVIFPDRVHGTMSFLIERGVPAWRILTAKLIIWWLTLILIAIIPSLVSYHITTLMIRDLAFGRNVVMAGTVPRQEGLAVLMFTGVNTGLFTIGVLSASWIRRPILAVIVGLAGVILWVIWSGFLFHNNYQSGMAFYWPIGMCIIGYFAFGTSTLLELANWKSKVRRVAWVMLIVGGSLFGLRNFRTHEIPAPMSFGEGQSLLNRYAENVRINASHVPGRMNQPGWQVSSDAESTVYQLNLSQPSCDLSAALKSLATGMEVTSEKARSAQGEGSLIEAIKMRRLVLSAIRKWANHPAQTAALLEEAAQKFDTLGRGDRFGAIDFLAYQYQAAIRAIGPGPFPTDISTGQPTRTDNSLIRLILKLAGEQERVRRLVEYQFSLLPNYLSADSPLVSGRSLTLETTCVKWTRNTSLSSSALGVNLPDMVYMRMFREEMRQIHISSLATSLVLKLQLSRLKNGQFPSTLVEVMQPNQIDASSFGYEPNGFARNLRISPLKALPAHQPVVYYRGDAPYQGMELVDPGVDGRAFYRARGWTMGDLNYMPRKDIIERSSPLQLSAQTEYLAQAEGPMNPHEIRFVSLGSPRDEDRLCLPPAQRVDVNPEVVIQQDVSENCPMIGADGTMQVLTPSAEPVSPESPSSEIPPVPPQSQPTGDIEE